MTIVVKENEEIVEQIVKQLNKLIDVIKVVELNPEKSVFREIALIKINVNPKDKMTIMQTVNIFRANIIDLNNESMIIEITGDEDKITAFIDLMRAYGIKEIVRTGLTALSRGPNIISEL